MKKVTNEYSQAVFNLPWLVAQEEGLFAAEGIEVEFLRARQWAARAAPVGALARGRRKNAACISYPLSPVS